MFRTRILGLFRLFRFELPFTAGVCVILGELLALGKFPTTTEIVLGFLSIFFISATSLILNDYFDIESDKINAPERPLPAGLVTERDVVLLSIVVTMLGFITGYLITVLHQLDQKIIYPHYDFKHLTEKYFEIGMKLNDFSIQLVKYCIWLKL